MNLIEQRGSEILARLGNCYSVLGAEVGVYDGRLSAYLLRECPNLTLLMVDRWAAVGPEHSYAKSESQMAQHTQEDWIAIMNKALSATAFGGGRAVPLQAESADIARMLPAGSLDFAFIDAEHTYEAVKEDISLWWPRVRPGGFLCGHDWDHPECHIGHRDPNHRSWDVRAAVEEFFKPHQIQLGMNRTWFVRKHKDL